MRPTQAWFIVGVVLGASAAQRPRAVQAEVPKPGAIDPRADQLLRKMSADLGAMTSFRCDADHVTTVATKEGEEIQGGAESTIEVQRPNKLRVDRMGRRTGATLSYDGEDISVHDKRDNLYATAKAPNTLDAALDLARSQLSIDVPGAELLYSNPYAALMEAAVSGTYLGLEPVRERMCHHLAYRGRDADWQIWIEDGPQALPCRLAIRRKQEPGSPEYTVSLFNWQVDPPFSEGTFAFTPPPGASRVELAIVADRVSHLKR